MLSKLLKYDFRSLRRFGLPTVLVLAGVFALGMLDQLLLNYAMTQMSVAGAPPIWTVIMILAMLFQMLVNLVVSGATVAMQIIILVDFYQTLVTDQGYLTFTLPVRPSQILTSKLISGSCWMLLVTVLALVGMLGVQAMSFVGMPIEGGADVFALLFASITSGLTSVFSAGELAVIGAMIVLLIPVSVVNGLLLYYMAVFFASVVSRKNRVAVAIGCILGINLIYSIVSSIFVVVLFLISGMIGALANSVALFLEALLLLMLLLFAGTSVLFYFLTRGMMAKKLNLP